MEIEPATMDVEKGEQQMRSDGPLHGVTLPSSADHVLLLRNPTAGSGATVGLVESLIGQLEQRGFVCEICTDLSLLSAAVDRLAGQGRLRTVIAAGGDGTAETVANLTPAGTALTVFPLGTENLLAKYLGLRADPTFVAQAIEQGRAVRLDAGELRIADAPPRLFLLMLGCGFDAEVIHRLHQARVGHITHLSYAKPILDAIRKYDYPTVNVSYDDDSPTAPEHHITAHWVFVFNTPSYASGLEIFPDANPFDGELDLITFRGGSFWHGLLHLGSILVGRHRQRRCVQTARAKSIRITSDRPVPIQVDGDPGGSLPIELRVRPGRVTAIVPKEWTNGAKIR